MGLNDREYWREVPIYRRLMDRDAELAETSWSPPATAVRARPWARVVPLGLIVAVAGLAFAYTHRGGSLPTPLAPLASISATPHTFSFNGPTQAVVGSTLHLTGSIAPQFTGDAEIDGSWNGRPSVMLARTPVVNGNYELQVPLNIRGLVKLRLSLPDGGYSTTTITVT